MTERIEAVQRMQDYIAAHLTEPITLAELAGAARFSPWHAARMFREETGLTPAAYIRRLRLSRSALRLRDERCSVLDVALDLGYGSVDGYQRAFRRIFGVNPRQWATRPEPISLFIPSGVKYRRPKEDDGMKDTEIIFTQVTERPARKVIIRRGRKAADYFAYCEEIGCDVWGLLSSIRCLEGEPISMWLPERYRLAGTSEYVQGAEVPLDWDSAVPDGFDVIELPAAKYLRFQGEPYPEEEYGQAIGRMWAALESFDPGRFGLAWDADNPRIQLAPMGERGYIEYRAVKDK